MKNGSVYTHIDTNEVIEIVYKIKYNKGGGFYKYHNHMSDFVVDGKLILKDLPHTIDSIGIIYKTKLRKEYRKIGDL